jgi:CRP-like cAMP-binding protein
MTMSDNQRPSSELIQSFQLIKGLSPESIEWLLQEIEPILLEPGIPLTQENMTNRELYLIESGEISVQKRTPDGQEETVVTLQGPTVIGEMSCLLGRSSIATVLAKSKVKGWKLDTRRLREAPKTLYLRERLLERILKLVSTRLEATNQSVLKLLAAHTNNNKLSIQDIDQFTETWKAGLAFTDDFQDLDESWSFD